MGKGGKLEIGVGAGVGVTAGTVGAAPCCGAGFPSPDDATRNVASSSRNALETVAKRGLLPLGRPFATPDIDHIDGVNNSFSSERGEVFLKPGRFSCENWQRVRRQLRS